MFWFYLSYPRSDDFYVRTFYEDLSREVAIYAGVEPNEIGFFNKELIQTGDLWREKMYPALASARVFVPLYSPDYFHSSWCVRESIIFNWRVELYAASLPPRQERPQLIMPVLWTSPDRFPGSLSREIAPVPIRHSDFGGVYAREGLLYILKLSRHTDDYQEFLHAFARALVRQAEEHALPQPEGAPPAPPLAPVQPTAVTPPSLGVFISYRRKQAEWQARVLFEALCHRFGSDRVFMDVESIGPGMDFVTAIEQALAICKVLLVLIGPQWATITNTEGRRRLEDPDDIVRLEVKAALDRNLGVIPVLFDGISMPGRQQLPNSLASLARRNALELSSGNRFSDDIRRLLNAVERILN